MPEPVDIHVGRRVREARSAKGLSQEKLGNLLGISFQQVQKYEKGTNRIGASRLWGLSNALEVPVAYFFDGLEYETEVQEDFLPRRTIHMAHEIDNIQDEALRNQILNLIKAASSIGKTPHLQVVAAE